MRKNKNEIRKTVMRPAIDPFGIYIANEHGELIKVGEVPKLKKCGYDCPLWTNGEGCCLRLAIEPENDEPHKPGPGCPRYKEEGNG